MKTVSSDRELPDTLEPTKLDWEIVALAQRRARRLRAEAFTRAIFALWISIRSRVDRARALIECEPPGTCA
jgi:hypothetical protein